MGLRSILNKALSVSPLIGIVAVVTPMVLSINGSSTEPSVQPGKATITVEFPYNAQASFDFASNTGLELEIIYQRNLKKQDTRHHIITVGQNDAPGGPLYMGNIEAAVQTLAKSLNGSVEIVRYPTDFSSGSDLLDYLTDQDDPITVHSFGHGDDEIYWVSLIPSIASLDKPAIFNLSRDKREKLTENFSGGYWKFYGCHVAADNSYARGSNLAKFMTGVLGIKTIASNAWVFLERNNNGTYMFPASRERHRIEFEIRKPHLGIPSPDPMYDQTEAAWVTYTPK
ncbi:hypothetical protein COV16_07420 [Candidatus Woesearchaeota archaeon CG10_big_fil_rev_8_21_14_0_10_34_8]|nr:MAG: hypothetical protein COV16_07420 [Candidatus Woesearchaeota archaeon CG10_big_fil_rev_8_21_14_0_10_34_8]